MNIKRILALTLAAVLVLTMALAGCGQNEDASTPSTASGTDSASGADDESSTGGDASGVEQVLYLQQPKLATWDTATCVDSESCSDD